MKHISEELRNFLEVTGMPAAKLSKQAGVAQAYISRLINGKCDDVFSRRADALREAMLTLDHDAARKAGVGI